MARWIIRALLALLFLLAFATLAMVRLDHPAAEVEARWATPPSKFIDVDGMRVHVRERGTGPTLVLLHGSNSSLFTWEGWARELGGDHHIIAFDLPGHGLTGPDAKARYTPQDMAEFVDHVVTKLGADRFALAGNSMGGHIALAYTLEHPKRVEKLILIDSSGLPREEPRPLVFRITNIPLLGRLFVWVTPRFAVAASVRQVYGDPSKVTDEMIGLYDDLLLREGNREASRIRLALPEDSQTPRRLGELHLPVLILWGARDKWVLPKYGERLHQAIAGSKLVMLDGLGHVPMEEDPAVTARIARDFISQP